jgi:hypothetical protein
MTNNISIAITADVVDAQAKFSVMSAESKALTKNLNDLARQAAQGGMTDQLQADLNKAAEAALLAKSKMADLGASLKGQLNPAMNETGEAALSFGAKFEPALNVGMFLEFEAVAQQALHAVEAAFEATVGKSKPRRTRTTAATNRANLPLRRWTGLIWIPCRRRKPQLINNSLCSRRDGIRNRRPTKPSLRSDLNSTNGMRNRNTPLKRAPRRRMLRNGRNPPATLCVQRRLACSAGVKPAGVKVRAP